MLGVLLECQECVASEDLVWVEFCKTGPGLVIDEVRVLTEALADPTIALMMGHVRSILVLGRHPIINEWRFATGPADSASTSFI